MSVKFFTSGAFTTSGIYSATYEASGFEKENMGDYNPETFWYYNTTGIVYFTFYIPTSVGAPNIGGFFFFLNNYKDITSGSFTVNYGDSASGPWNSITGGAVNLYDTNGPIRYCEFTSTYSNQYYRVTLAGQNAGVRIGMAFPARVWETSIGAQYPANDQRQFHNKEISTAGGRTFVQRWNSRGTTTLNRTFVSDGETTKTAIQSAFNDSDGRLRPVLYQEGSSQYDAKLCRFQEPLLISQRDYQLYDVTFTLDEIPYTPSGQDY